jgi:predicted DCC family thiol-disulfide oxidoreductase YuxK
VQRLNGRDAISIQAWQTPGLLDRVQLTPQQCSESAWYVESGGAKHRGAAAIAHALGALGGIWVTARWLYRMPILSNIANIAYSWVAANRYRLPGSTDACAIPPRKSD